MNFTNLVVPSSVEEDSLSRGGLPRIDMSHDTYVTIILERELSLICRRVAVNAQNSQLQCMTRGPSAVIKNEQDD